jgi:hypothetical protein
MLVIPEKTLAFIPVNPIGDIKPFNGDVSTFLRPLNEDHTREWFTPNFYRCLPLSIGNMQGFVFSSPFDFVVVWDGTASIDGLKIYVDEDTIDEEIKDMNHVTVLSSFGHGICTMSIPVILKTPPGVNLMTIAPPNFPVPGISPMTGVVEADNLRFTFTFNFKVDLPNTPIKITKGYPIMGILPIPRYFCDEFTLVNGYDILDKDLIEEELSVVDENAVSREKQIEGYNQTGKDKPDRKYYKGFDAIGNKFEDHQLPKKKNS